MFPDDPRRGRSVRRDCLLPRFYIDAVGEYIRAMQSDDFFTIDQTREELLYIVSRTPGWKRKVFAYALTAMRSPRMTEMVISLRPYLRPIARRFI